MKVENLYPGAMASNCYLLTSGRHAAVVDPSASVEAILSALQKENAVLETILLTHGHFDHVFSLNDLRNVTGARVLIHEDDRDMPDDPGKNAFRQLFGMDRAFGEPDGTFSDGERIRIGTEELLVLHTPGHTAGSSCFLSEKSFLLTGDTLFADTHGRTDLYSGSPEKMIASLRRLRELPGTMTIYPGHGESAVLGDALETVFY